jgi:hypothetical protein
MQMPPVFPDAADAERLGARVLRPARPRLKEARAAVAGVRDPREAWEALAARDLIPMAWVGGAARTFRNGWKRSAPPTVDAAVMLGADAAGAATAEELVRECAFRLRELGYAAAPDAPVRWWFVPPTRNTLDLRVDAAWWQLGRFARDAAGQSFGLGAVPVEDRTSDALYRGAVAGRSFPDPRDAPPVGTDVVSHFTLEAMRALWSTRGWYLGARDGVVLPPPRDAGEYTPSYSRLQPRGATIDDGSAGGPWSSRPIAAAPDPFDPLLRLWATGYAPGCLDEAPTLYALDQPA